MTISGLWLLVAALSQLMENNDIPAKWDIKFGGRREQRNKEKHGNVIYVWENLFKREWKI